MNPVQSTATWVCPGWLNERISLNATEKLASSLPAAPNRLVPPAGASVQVGELSPVGLAGVTDHSALLTAGVASMFHAESAGAGVPFAPLSGAGAPAAVPYPRGLR